jgi:hypothetical protein
MDGQNFIRDVDDKSILRKIAHQTRQNVTVELIFSSYARPEILEASFSTESSQSGQ